MNYDDAMKACKGGSNVRHHEMGKGWSIFYIPKGRAKGFYCLNPHTGSDMAFRPTPNDLKSTAWTIYRPEREWRGMTPPAPTPVRRM